MLWCWWGGGGGDGGPSIYDIGGTVDSSIHARPPATKSHARSGNEAFDPAALGHAEEVVETRVGDGEMIYIKVCM